MRIPDETRKCVVYLGKDYGDGKELDVRYSGTGFFVAKPSKLVPGAAIMALVTAKHVADKLINGRCFVRANKKSGISFNLEIPQGGKWYFHPSDSAADVAVIPLGMSHEEFDFQPISTDLLLTEKDRLEKGIGIPCLFCLSIQRAQFGKNIFGPLIIRNHCCEMAWFAFLWWHPKRCGHFGLTATS
jgi:hypothetical protein